MNRRSIAIIAVAAAAILAGSLFFLQDSGGDSAATGNMAPAPSKSVARDDQEPEQKKPTAKIPKIDPADYTTAPKPNSDEGRMLKIFMDRSLTDLEKAERILAMCPHLPEIGKKQALDYATQVIPDEDYVRLRPRLLSIATTDELREVVMLDMLTRDDGIKMTSLVELLRQPSTATRADAREILVAFLDEDHGDDPNRWEAPVRKWVAENGEF